MLMSKTFLSYRLVVGDVPLNGYWQCRVKSFWGARLDTVMWPLDKILSLYTRKILTVKLLIQAPSFYGNWTPWGPGLYLETRPASIWDPGTGRYSDSRYSDKCFWKGATNTNSNRNLNPNPNTNTNPDLNPLFSPSPNPNSNINPNPLHYPFRNVGIAVVGIAAVSQTLLHGDSPKEEKLSCPV